MYPITTKGIHESGATPFAPATIKPTNDPIVIHSAARRRKRRGLNRAFGGVGEDTLCVNMDMIRRQSIWYSSRRKSAERGPHLDVDIMRESCRAASAGVRWFASGLRKHLSVLACSIDELFNEEPRCSHRNVDHRDADVCFSKLALRSG
ncbi:MAG TPA: hypothetical protein VGD20_12040 [Sphingopyxis sp.]